MSLGQLFAKPSRVVLLHYHIFKNAGSTIDFALKQNFGHRLAYLHGNRFDSMVSNSALLDFLTKNLDVAAVSSHHLRPPAPVVPSIRFLEILVVREPLDRLCSIYDFYRRTDQLADPLAGLAKKLELGPYVRALRDKYPHLLRSPQLNFIANQGKAIPDSDDFARGVSLIRNVAILGTTEMLAEALTIAEFALRRELNKLDFSYMSQNVTRDHRGQPARERLQQACAADFFVEVCEAVQFDAELHCLANAEIRRRFQALPDRQKRLEDFQSRCRQHERNAEMIIAASNHPDDFVRFIN
jgi:hypothetical protein